MGKKEIFLKIKPVIGLYFQPMFSDKTNHK